MTAHSTRYYDPPVRFRDVITRKDVDALAVRGQKSLTLGADATITDEAREQALKLGIAIQAEGQASRASGGAASSPSSPPPANPAPAPARAVPAISSNSPTSRALACASPASIIEAVVAELHARDMAPALSLVQEVVAKVNAALASARH